MCSSDLDVIDVGHLPPDVLSGTTRRLSRIESFERDEIIRVLTRPGITMREAAEELGAQVQMLPGDPRVGHDLELVTVQLRTGKLLGADHGLAPTEVQRFLDGRADFTHAFTAAEGLGPIFNQSSCGSCHNNPVEIGRAHV